MNRPATHMSTNLVPAEKLLFGAIRELAFGRLEKIAIRQGLPVLDPWPLTIRTVRFGSDPAWPGDEPPCKEFQLTRPFVEMFAATRALGCGEIVRLEVRHSVPVLMEITPWQPEEVKNG